jgi:glutamate carboxypeptidase
MKLPRYLIHVLLTAMATAAFAQGVITRAPALTSQEARIVTSVDRRQSEAVALLERLVNVNSGTFNLSGVTRVGEMLRAELATLGFAVSWSPMAATGRAGHLIATHEGRPGAKRLLLIGHLDTVFEADSPFQEFIRKGDTANGPGASDDKGGIVVMVTALQAMEVAGALKRTNIEIVLTGDEEDVGAPLDVARADLVAAGKRADVALDFEGLAVLDGRDMGSIARRSANGFVIATRGVSEHSSSIFSPKVGDGAIFELARIIAAFRAELPEPNLTFNIGLMAGGTTATFNAEETAASASGKTNIIPGQAVANGDFRTLTTEQTARVRARMEAIVAQHAPGTGATITFRESYPPMAPTAGNRELLAQLNKINLDLGLPVMPELDPLLRGAGDISFVAQDVDALVGLGTASTGDHTPAETVDLRSMRRQAVRAALLMTRLSHEPSTRHHH